MKTGFNALDVFYKTINVTGVKSTLDGKVYRRKRPINSRKRDVVILTLPVRNPDISIVQTGVVVVNCYAPNLTAGTDDKSGTPNETRLKATADAVITALEAYSMGSMYFDFDLDSENLYQDTDDPQMSYVSLRVTYRIEK